MKINKTNAARLLDKAKIAYELFTVTKAVILFASFRVSTKSI